MSRDAARIARMALSTVTEAQTQYAANLSEWWASTSKSKLLLEAVEYLLANRIVSGSNDGDSLRYSEKHLLGLRDRLYTHLGVSNGGDRARFLRGRCL